MYLLSCADDLADERRRLPSVSEYLRASPLPLPADAYDARESLDSCSGIASESRRDTSEVDHRLVMLARESTLRWLWMRDDVETDEMDVTEWWRLSLPTIATSSDESRENGEYLDEEHVNGYMVYSSNILRGPLFLISLYKSQKGLLVFCIVRWGYGCQTHKMITKRRLN